MLGLHILFIPIWTDYHLRPYNAVAAIPLFLAMILFIYYLRVLDRYSRLSAFIEGGDSKAEEEHQEIAKSLAYQFLMRHGIIEIYERIEFIVPIVLEHIGRWFEFILVTILRMCSRVLVAIFFFIPIVLIFIAFDQNVFDGGLSDSAGYLRNGTENLGREILNGTISSPYKQNHMLFALILGIILFVLATYAFRIIKFYWRLCRYFDLSILFILSFFVTTPMTLHRRWVAASIFGGHSGQERVRQTFMEYALKKHTFPLLDGSRDFDSRERVATFAARSFFRLQSTHNRVSPRDWYMSQYDAIRMTPLPPSKGSKTSALPVM
jgi:hypothetical protein